MKRNKSLTLAIVFIAMVVILLVGVSMVSQIPLPDSSTDEYSQFSALASIVNIGYYGYAAVLLVIVAASLILAVAYMKKKR